MKLLWHMPTLQRISCGLSIRALNFARQLRHRGHEIVFAVARDKTDCINGVIDGFPIQLLDVSRQTPRHWSLQAAERVRAAADAVSQVCGEFDAIVTCQPEAVIAFRNQLTSRIGRSVSNTNDTANATPIIFVCGGTTLLHDHADVGRNRDASRLFRRALAAPAFAIDRALKRRNERRAFYNADVCVFDSDSTRSRVMDAYGLRPEKCHALRGAVDADKFHPPTSDERLAARRRFAIADDEIAIAWTGRMSPEKNLDTLIRAIPLCRNPKVRLLLAGDGAERPRLEKICEDSDTGFHATTSRAGSARRVQFLRNLSNVRPLLHAADVFAFPSISESLGLSLIEAMACELAAIALKADERTIRNASTEMLDNGRCGRLVVENSASAFAAAIDDLAANSAERARLAANARRQAVSTFRWAASTEIFESLITERICRSKGQANPMSTEGARGCTHVEHLAANAPESMRA